MNTYTSYTGLIGNTLDYGDEVIFRIDSEEINYAVRGDYLENLDGEDNNYIFRLLDLDTYDFASAAYGYGSNSGDWPTFEDEDYEAATRLVIELFRLCGGGNIENWKDILTSR